jgi:hypothetical protein
VSGTICYLQHEFHERVASWVHTLASRGVPELLTYSITELGFVRVLAQAPQYGFTIALARILLLRPKTQNSLKFTFIADDHDVSHLPAWAKNAKQTAYGHLVQLAKAKSAIVATLDERIRGAFLIPTHPKVK